MNTREHIDVIVIAHRQDEAILKSDPVQLPSPRFRGIRLTNCGFTLVELLMVIAILAALATVAIQSWPQVKNIARKSRAISEIHNIATAIEAYQADKGVLPPDIAAVGYGSFNDPWGTPYRYRPISNPAGSGTPAYSRKDGFGNELNSENDYDLFSEGPDRTSAEWITDAPDDIVRAANGSFLGEASTYSP